MSGTGWQFWIDVGGTFTDCIGRDPSGDVVTHKLLSTGVYKGVGRLSADRRTLHGVDLVRGAPPGFFDGFSVRAATECDSPDGLVVARFDPRGGWIELSAALRGRAADAVAPREPGVAGSAAETLAFELSCGLEAPVVAIRRLLGLRLDQPIGGVALRLGTTRATNALLERKGASTALVTTAGFGDILRIGYQDRPRLFDLNIVKAEQLYALVIELDERVDSSGKVLRPLDESAARGALRTARDQGIASLAICLLNSYRNPAHEQRVAQLAREIGFDTVSVSTDLSPLPRIVPRGETTVVDAYVTPVLHDYLRRLAAAMPHADIKLMTSSGGLADVHAVRGRDALLSGPAGGVNGVAHVAAVNHCLPAIGFDMGGTSTDVCRFDGRHELRHETLLRDPRTAAHTRIVAPMLAIETVAAGGGSVCWFDGVKPAVGPHSAAADPGPACYGAGGPLCITDCNLLLGRIARERFAFPLDLEAAERRIDELRERIARDTGRDYTREELAAGYLDIANAHVTGAMRRISTSRGLDPRSHALVAFGGAGGQHACAVALALGMRRVIVPRFAGLLSALGVGLAEMSAHGERDVGEPLSPEFLRRVEPRFAALADELRQRLVAQGASPERLASPRRSLELRYAGQSTSIEVVEPSDGAFADQFARLHREQFGFVLPGRAVEVASLRVELRERRADPSVPEQQAAVSPPPRPQTTVRAWFDTWCDTPLFERDALCAGAMIAGPAIMIEPNGTVVVERGWTATISARGDVVLSPVDAPALAPAQAVAAQAVEPAGAAQPDPILLELFNNRFAAIAEEMGAALQRSALSVNVRERLDFSCAIFDPSAALVVNAPHIPVHLGSMSECVRQLAERCPDMQPGDVFVTNHPFRGGTHLPDVTVVTPVFIGDGPRPDFFTASRAHHAEIGGITPGSMPPFSKRLAEEGVLIDAVKLIDAGVSREDELRALLSAGPFASRRVDENLADVHAQAAANQTGALRLRELVDSAGLSVVTQYMRHIQAAAEAKTRRAIARLPGGTHRFADALDDGTPLCVTLRVAGDSVEIDFAGSGPVHAGNLNANRAIVTSAILYCLRCLIDEDIPLNAGVLAPVRIRIPRGLLDPARTDAAHWPAVVGGNVETSQRVVDCILGALGLVAASQGTMNNLIFGDETFGYYETICGGSGAGPTFNGADAVHTHMTNTRLTDPEVLEARYPVRLLAFAIRRGSGGSGRHRGGDGVIRQLEFLAPLELSLLTQRRTRRPFGLAGGAPGQAGRNTLRRAADGTIEDLGPVAHRRVAPGDVLTIETPGGGGYGGTKPASV